MPIYEYQATSGGCAWCEDPFEVIQSPDDAPIKQCAACGALLKRLVGKPEIKIARGGNADKAAKKGLTTFRKVEEGKWEKIAGPGVDMIVGSPEDIASVKQEKAKDSKK